MKTARENYVVPSEKATLDELKALRPLVAHAIDAIATGNPNLTEDKLLKLVWDAYFAFPSLTPLQLEEGELLGDLAIHDFVLKRYRRLEKLVGDVYFDGKQIFGFKDHAGRAEMWVDFCDSELFMSPVHKAEVLASKTKVRKLTIAEKLFVAFGVSTGKTSVIEKFLNKQNRPDRVSGWGNRKLLGEFGYMKKETFERMCKEIRERTGRVKLKALDIGGGVGKALFQMKQVDPNIETTNLTLEQEPLQLPVDHVVNCMAERMPENFFEQFDIVLSNVSIRYHALPHKTLQNAVLALSVGGEAKLSVGCDSIPHSTLVENYYAPFANGKKRQLGAEALIKEERERLKRLEALGIVKLTYHTPSPGKDADKWGSGYYEIVKLKSISVEDYLNA